jgi:thioredoxin reductase (NADPH)
VPKPVILVVDDDPEVLRAVLLDLRARYGRDYRLLPADSGEAALTLLGQLADREHPVALILSDQRMPRMDGVTFLSRASASHPATKRILLTAYADTEAAIAAINESRVHYYLLKPWDPPEERLYPVVDDMLEEWRQSFRPGYGGVRVVADRWSARGHAIRDFLARNQVPYTFTDVESSVEGRTLASGLDPSQLPLVVLPGGRQLHAPELGELAEKVGLRSKAKETLYDLAIVGAGPGGLASAVYGGSEGLRTVLIESEAPGGQAGTSSRIENYLGFPSGLSGSDLARRAVAQARRFGVEILTPQLATGLRIEGPYRHIDLADGSEISAHVVMLAVGVSWNRLPAAGADDLVGAGVYYGAALTEAMNVKGRTVWMVGAGNSAGQAAMYFKDYADRVVMLVRGGALGARMSRYLVDRIEATENIEVREGTEVVACRGSGHLQEIDLQSADGTFESVPAEFLFAFLGAAPRTEWLRGRVALDDGGFILTGPDLDPDTHLSDWPLEREPYLLETCIPGVFACGDARHASVKRVASAVGEGSVSVTFMHQILAER